MKRLTCLYLVGTLIVSSTALAGTIRTVALSGQPAPGAPSSVNFFEFAMPVLNDAGKTAFWANINNGGLGGIWSEGSGSLELVASYGDHAPGTPDGVNFSNFTRLPSLNDAGQTAFWADLTGSGVVYLTNDQGIWSEGSGTLALIARSGNSAPGLPDGVSFTGIHDSTVLNDAGQTAFMGRLTGSGALNSGTWSDRSGSLALVARSGEQAPGTPGGVNFCCFGSYSLALNNGGQTAFITRLVGTEVNLTNDRSIWSEGSGSLALVAREGSQAPGTPSGVNFEFSISIPRPALNNAGQTAFFGTLTGGGADTTNNKGIWSDRSGSLALVARSGEQAPGTPSGANFSGFSSFVQPALNDAGQIAFVGFLTGSGVDATNSNGLWLGAPGNLALVARSGEHPPGTEDGVVFGSFSASFNDLVVNATGQIAFTNFLGGGAFNQSSIWATDRSGQLQLIARAGDLLEVAPGEFRTIAYLFNDPDSISTGNSDGRPSFFNNLGQLAFSATFTDGSTGVFVSDRVAIPEPSTLLLLGLGAVGTLLLRRRLGFGRRSLSAAIAASFLFVAATSIAQAAMLRTVALSGQQAPGTPSGENFNSFYPPMLNDAGQTAFFAFPTAFTTSMGLWSEGSGSLALVAQTGQQAPGMPEGVSFSFNPGFDKLVLNDAGQTIFKSFIQGPGVVGCPLGVWSEGSGALALVAGAGDHAPGTPSGVNFGGSDSHPVLNDAGQTAFSATLTGSGLDVTNNRGIWSEGSGSLALVAHTGEQAPGTPSGVAFFPILSQPALNNAGQTAFRAVLTGAGVNSTNNLGIWSEGSGNLALVARKGSSAPGIASGVNFLSFVGVYLALNNASQTAFRADLTGSGVDSTNDTGIWSDRSGSLDLVAREGSQAPRMPSGVNYGSFANDPLLNDAGQTAFISSLIGTGVDSTNDTGIWSEGSGSLALVAREGDHAPGTPDGVVFDEFFDSPLVLNAAGQTAFYTYLTGIGVDSTNNVGFWATDPSGDLQLIARMGDLLEVAPGDFRTIDSTIRPHFSTGNGDGRGSFFNNVGQLAFWAQFTDGSSGVFVSNRVAVPEPSTLLLFAAGVGVCALMRRRNAHKDNINDARAGRVRRASIALALVVGAALHMPSAAQAAKIRTVALSGQHAPGTPDGANFIELRFPVLNDAGQTAFYAASGAVGTIPDGIWSEGSGSLSLVAHNGHQVPGMPDGVSFGIFEGSGRLVINDAGQTTFFSSINGVGTSTRAVWSDRSGSLELVARTGDQAPGTPSGVTFSSELTSYLLNNAGQTAFLAGLSGSDVVGVNNNGIWSERFGGLALVARAGDQAPGTPSGVNFFSPSVRALNDAGQVAFTAGLMGAGVNITNNSGVWSEGSGSLALLARRGDHAPGTASGVNFDIFSCCGPVLNNAGHTAFGARLAGSGVDATNKQGIWSDRSGSLELVARTGEQAPGTPSGVNFSVFGQNLALNDSDHTAFYAALVGTSVDSTNEGSLWSESSGSLGLVAREGDQAPGTPSGVVFSLFFDRLVLNDAGQFAFSGNLTGNGVDFTNDKGIWATDRSGQLQLIARKGDLLEVAPGDFRTILDPLTFSSSSGNSDGGPSYFNNRGQLAFLARFTDGSTGVFVSDRVAVPEPSTLLLFGCAAGAAIVGRAVSRRTRRRDGSHAPRVILVGTMLLTFFISAAASAAPLYHIVPLGLDVQP